MSDGSLSENEGVDSRQGIQPNLSTAHNPDGAACPAVPENWTVKGKIGCKVPTSNDYGQWNIQQLRRECAARGKKLPRGGGTEKEMRVAYLLENDNDRQLLLLAVDPELAKPTVLRKEVHDAARLINVLLSDRFIEDLVRSKDQAGRHDLDVRAINSESPFWQQVEIAYATNTTDFNGNAMPDDPRFNDLNPAIITPHDAATLRKMWKEMPMSYRAAFKNSVLSGEHSEDFLEYCNGRVGIAYLHYSVGTRHANVISFVRTMMPESAKLDSTKPQQRQSGKGKRPWRESIGDGNDDQDLELRKTLKLLMGVLEKRECERATADTSQGRPRRSDVELLDCISRSYGILAQLETTKNALEGQGRCTKMLQQSIKLQEVGIQKIEAEYAARMGIRGQLTSNDASGETKEDEDGYIMV